MTQEERIVDLEKRLTEAETILVGLQNAVKVEKNILQTVVEREGDVVKVRRKVFLKTATEQKEAWEDVTDKFTKKQKEDMLNGA